MGLRGSEPARSPSSPAAQPASARRPQHDSARRAAWWSSATSPSTPRIGPPNDIVAAGWHGDRTWGSTWPTRTRSPHLHRYRRSDLRRSRRGFQRGRRHEDAIRADTDVVDIDFDVWDRVMTVNLRGYVAAMKHAIPHMLARGGGAIVNMSSAAAFQGEPARPAYATAKAGIGALTTPCRVAVGKGGHPLQRRRARIHRHRGHPVRPAMAGSSGRRAQTHPRAPRRRPPTTSRRWSRSCSRTRANGSTVR